MLKTQTTEHSEYYSDDGGAVKCTYLTYNLFEP